MYELKVTVTKVLGTCTADPAMKAGDYITVLNGDIRIPDDGYICLYALQSILPLITPKEREIAEEKDEDWMWRVHHAQCPDPQGRVIFKIERTGKVRKETAEKQDPANIFFGGDNVEEDASKRKKKLENGSKESRSGLLRDLRVVVEEVKGKCTSGMRPGDCFFLRSGRLYIPANRHFCLYALHAALPLLPAKQRPLEDGDWLKADSHVSCPDPAGNVIMRIEHMPQEGGQ